MKSLRSRMYGGLAGLLCSLLLAGCGVKTVTQTVTAPSRFQEFPEVPPKDPLPPPPEPVKDTKDSR